jgi:glycerol kinase
MAFIAAIDQGTTSSRCLIFDHSGRLISSSQKEHKQIFPRPGWVEHDPNEIFNNCRELFKKSLDSKGLNPKEIQAIGITNQRETSVLWNRRTGQPYCNAIVWQDTRTDEICDSLKKNGLEPLFQKKTGLPLSTYFSGPKIRWMIDHYLEIQEGIKKDEVLFGTIDSWLIWNFTGGCNGGIHVTDPTNASRTLLMNLETLSWDETLLEILHIPRGILPEIKSSSEVYGYFGYGEELLPISGDLGDQQAALFGQACFAPGMVKNTYGTGCFMLLNTGESIVPSQNGLLTTVAYHIGTRKPVFCLEGSIAITGALVQWLRDNLGLINSSAEIEQLAMSVDDNGGVYFVPAFSGLFAPYWKSDARGLIIGLTRFANKGHIARAALEATAFQTKEVLDAMITDSGIELKEIRVDGGMVFNNLLMQFQSNILGVPVIRPIVSETTSLGAAYAAGLSVGFWNNLEDLSENWHENQRWRPAMEEMDRSLLYANWKRAVQRTFDWVQALP